MQQHTTVDWWAQQDLNLRPIDYEATYLYSKINKLIV